MEVAQRQLEVEISRLRREHQHIEKRILGLDTKVTVLAEKQLKRKRDGDNDTEDEQSDSKKLRSVVSAVAERSPSPERRPQLKTNAQDERRTRRLFGILQGTLSKFSEEKKQEEQKDTIRTRMEVEKEIDERIDTTRQEALHKEQQKAAKEKEDLEGRAKELHAVIEEKAKELSKIRRDHYESLLSHFAKTDGVKPPLYFLPAKLDEWTEKEFGIKNPRVAAKENTEKKDEDLKKDRVDTADGENDDDGEAVIVEIKEGGNEETIRTVKEEKAHTDDKNESEEEKQSQDRQSESESSSEEK